MHTLGGEHAPCDADCFARSVTSKGSCTRSGVDQQHQPLAARHEHALGHALKRRRQPRCRGQPRVGLGLRASGARASICTTSEPTIASGPSQFVQPGG